jgi:hypothetical protein
MNIDLTLNIASWMVVGLFALIGAVTLLDIRAIRNNQIPRTTAPGPDYLDAIYAFSPLTVVVFILSVLWLIFG